MAGPSAASVEATRLHARGTVVIVVSEHGSGTTDRVGAVLTTGGRFVPVAGIHERGPGRSVDVLLSIPAEVAVAAGLAGGGRIEADSKAGEAVIQAATEPFVIVEEVDVPQPQDLLNIGAAIKPVKPRVDVAIIKGASATAAKMVTEVETAGEYWRTSTNGHIDGFAVTKSQVKSYTSALGCRGNFDTYIREAAKAFGRTPDFYRPAITATPRFLVVVLPDSCRDRQPWGEGTVGGMRMSGAITLVGRTSGYQATLVHEFGHNLGLDHANGADRDCAKGRIFTQNVTCRINEYWDLYSPMALEFEGLGPGDNPPPAIDAPHRAYLDGFAPGQLKTQGFSTTRYTLRFAGSATGVTSIKVVSPVDGRIYFVEYRSGAEYPDSKAAYRYFARDPRTGLQIGCLVPSAACTTGVGYGYGVRVSRLVSKWEGSMMPGSSIAYPVATNSSFLSFQRYAFGPGDRWISEDRTIEVRVVSTSDRSAVVDVAKRKPQLMAGKPTIAGVPKVGETLVAKLGTWLPTPSTFFYQWYRGAAAIPGATSNRYKVASADVGKALKLRITAQRAGFAAVTATTPATAKVARVEKAPEPSVAAITTVKPVVIGKLAKWKTLTVDPGRWQPAGVRFSYQWLRDGKAIPGATAATYKITAADLGRKLSVAVTGTKAGFAAATRTTHAGTPQP